MTPRAHSGSEGVGTRAIGAPPVCGRLNNGTFPPGKTWPDDPFGLLKWLDEPVQQNPVKAPIAKANAVPVMLVEGVHGRPP
jgi:hypothetical protein